MRTAEEIIKWAFDNTPDNSMISEVYVVAVNEARKECIRECAELSNSKRLPSLITKQSILSLIEQVK